MPPRAGDSYPLVDPRLEEAHDDGTVVQSPGEERSLAQPHVVTNNPPCFQHKTGGAKNKAETGNGDSIHDDSHHGARNKAETNIGDSIHGNSHHGAENKVTTRP